MRRDGGATALGGLRHRARYRLDDLLSRGTWAVLLWLGVVMVVAVLVSSALLAIFGVRFTGGEDGSWIEDVWQSLLRMLDTGTMAGDAGWGPRLLALVVTIFGVLVAGTLIGLIASGVERRVDEMQRARTTIIESDHIVLLGASSRLPTIVEQLALAGQHRRRNTIVVLAEVDATELRDAVRASGASLLGSRLVVRAGVPDRVSDLAMVRLDRARAAIVLADDDADDDTGVVKAVLAVGAALGGFDSMTVVAELREPQMAQRLVEACGPRVEPLLAVQAIARLTSYSLREPGLREVLDELLDSRGSDLYLHDPSTLTDEPFATVVRRFDGARPIGILRADGSVELNPAAEARAGEGDQLIFIAEDGALEAPSSVPFDEGPTAEAPAPWAEPTERVEHLLFVGWNPLGATLLASVQEFCTAGSTAEIVYDPEVFDVDQLQVPTGPNLTLTLTPSPRLGWEPRHVTDLGAKTSIVLLGYTHEMSAGEADSRTLLNLMLLRRTLDERSGARPRVVAELRDTDNLDLARASGADDYIVSDAIASRLMTQLAEQPQRRAILLALYLQGGPSLRLVAVDDLGVGGAVRFGEVVSAAQRHGLLAIGLRYGDGRAEPVALNPRASEPLQVTAADQVIVIG